MLFLLESAGLTAKRISRKKLRKYAESEALYSDKWLLAYEGGMRKWIASDATYIRNDTYFREFEKIGLSFIDEAASLTPIFSAKEMWGAKLDLFDSEDDVSRYFDFIDVSEDYVDRRRREHSEDDDEPFPIDAMDRATLNISG